MNVRYGWPWACLTSVSSLPLGARDRGLATHDALDVRQMSLTDATVAFALALGLLLAPAPSLRAQDGTDRVLQARLEALVEGFRGDVGIYVRHLETGRWAALDADALFPTASMVKVPILLKTFQDIEAGTLSLDDKLLYRDSLLYEGEDILGSFKDGEEITLSKVVMLMITMSDNTASLWLQALSGGGEAINGWLAEHGFEKTRVNSRTDGRRPDWEVYGWGQTTPREMAELLVMIREGRAVSPTASEEMYRYLTRSYWDDEALSQIPPTVQAASKQGAVNRSRSEVVLVNAPHGDYVFCVITKNQEDKSWGGDNEGFVLLRDVSRLLWQYFEPEWGGAHRQTPSSTPPPSIAPSASRTLAARPARMGRQPMSPSSRPTRRAWRRAPGCLCSTP